MSTLAGKVAIVTGASKGIGAAIAKAFAAKGASVVVNYASNEKGAGAVVDEIRRSVTPPNSAVYSGTKGAVDAITGVLARELGPRQIRVNALNPGFVNTEGTRAAGFVGSDFEKGTVQDTPLGRSGKPDDIASIAVFLASNGAGWLTGEQLLASGGLR